MENKPASLYLCLWERHSAGFPHLGVKDRWPATLKRARYSALIAFLWQEENYATKYKKVTSVWTNENQLASSACMQSSTMLMMIIEAMLLKRPITEVFTSQKYSFE